MNGLLTVCHEAAEVAAHDTVPSGTLAVIELEKRRLQHHSAPAWVRLQLFLTVFLICWAMSFSIVNLPMASCATSMASDCISSVCSQPSAWRRHWMSGCGDSYHVRGFDLSCWPVPLAIMLLPSGIAWQRAQLTFQSLPRRRRAHNLLFRHCAIWVSRWIGWVCYHVSRQWESVTLPLVREGQGGDPAKLARPLSAFILATVWSLHWGAGQKA